MHGCVLLYAIGFPFKPQPIVSSSSIILSIYSQYEINVLYSFTDFVLNRHVIIT